MVGFELLTLAADDYPESLGPLAASAVADRLKGFLARGGDLVQSRRVVIGAKNDLDQAMLDWSDAEAARSSIIYLIGHGEADGITHKFIVPDPDPKRGHRAFETKELAQYFKSEWLTRQLDEGAWTVLILDSCQSEVGIGNLVHELEANQFERPRQLCLCPVGGAEAVTLATFVDAFEHEVKHGFTENDDAIRLNEVLRRALLTLGKAEKRYDLPDTAVLTNPKRSNVPIMLTVDSHAEFQALVAGRDDDFRNHFLSKAQGAESGELAWYFSGRDTEIEELCGWLGSKLPGMHVITGEAGSGKSALLGHLAVLADRELVDAYVSSGLARELDRGPLPPADVFDAVIHLTGKSESDVLRAIQSAAVSPSMAVQAAEDLAERNSTEEPPTTRLVDRTTVRHSIRMRRPPTQGARPFTILVDAVDEAEEPLEIADTLAFLTEDSFVQILVGTRRSLREGPDVAPDPDQREILDSLRVDDSDVRTLLRDQRAALDYSRQRLEAAGYDEESADDLAQLIADAQQPFLFARLATSEIRVAYAPAVPSKAELDRLLGNGHRGIFHVAMERIRESAPAVAVAVETLALARGRGMPRDRGVWLRAAAVIGEMAGVVVVERDIERTLTDAAPYLTLDGEAGVSTYRLAHRTFVEHFRDDFPQRWGHGEIARALIQTNGADDEPWAAANHYEVRYVVEHLTIAAENGQWAGSVASFLMSGEWLARALEVLPLEVIVDVLATAHRRMVASGAVEDGVDAIDTVGRALQRSRSALGRRRGRLGPQLHARLHLVDDPAIAGLGRCIAERGGEPWLEMTLNELEWSCALASEHNDVGTVRALAFGHVDGEPRIAIGIREGVDLWDPRKGGPDPADRIEFGMRPTAVALGEVDGHPVVAAAMGYDGVARVVRLDGMQAGVDIEYDINGYVDSIAIGDEGGGAVVTLSASGIGALGRWRIADGERIDHHPTFDAGEVRGLSTIDGMVVAHVLHRTAEPGAEFGAGRFDVVEVSSGRALAHAPVTSMMVGKLRLVSGAMVGGRLRCLAAVDDHTQLWDADTDDPVDWHSPVSDHVRDRIRTVALGEVDGTGIVITGPDLDGSGVVLIRQIDEDDGALVSPAIGGLLREKTSQMSRSSPSLPPENRKGGWSLDRLHDWPRTSYQDAVDGDQRFAVTGSIDGSAFVWSLSVDPPTVIAGPFRDIDEMWLERAPLYSSKAGPEPTSDAALGEVPGEGLCVAIAAGGVVRLVRLDGSATELPRIDEADLGVVAAVAMGQLGGWPVLVTGSRGGRISVLDLHDARLLTEFRLDESISELQITPDQELLARTGLDEEFGFRLAVPAPRARLR